MKVHYQNKNIPINVIFFNVQVHFVLILSLWSQHLYVNVGLGNKGKIDIEIIYSQNNVFLLAYPETDKDICCRFFFYLK